MADAAAQGKRVMLYFGQDGCPYCKRLLEVNFRRAAIAAKAQRQLVALALNIWGDREVTWRTAGKVTEKRLAAQLKVQFTPTLVFLDERGGIALRLNGYLGRPQLRKRCWGVGARHALQPYIRPVKPADRGFPALMELARAGPSSVTRSRAALLGSPQGFSRHGAVRIAITFERLTQFC